MTDDIDQVVPFVCFHTQLELVSHTNTNNPQFDVDDHPKCTVIVELTFRNLDMKSRKLLQETAFKCFLSTIHVKQIHKHDQSFTSFEKPQYSHSVNSENKAKTAEVKHS